MQRFIKETAPVHISEANFTLLVAAISGALYVADGETE